MINYPRFYKNTQLTLFEYENHVMLPCLADNFYHLQKNELDVLPPETV
jgi:hypothetical protein